MNEINIITGATSAGKSSIALTIGRDVKNIEIISADAFQVYKGFDIGTAKITVEERQSVIHHLIDIVEPEIAYSAGKFVEEAEKLIEEINNRGNTPLIVGGTGLYIKSLTDGIFNSPAIDKSIRTKLENKLKEDGIHSLYEKLKKRDPIYASKISNNDPIRNIRALEIIESLGIPFTEAHKLYHKPPKFKYKLSFIEYDRKLLYDNINKRTQLMWKAGWCNEVKTILDKGIPISAPAFRAIGYKDIANHILNNGNEEKLLEKIALDTRHFAKRQLTWFRGINNVYRYNNISKLYEDILYSIKRL